MDRFGPRIIKKKKKRKQSESDKRDAFKVTGEFIQFEDDLILQRSPAWSAQEKFCYFNRVEVARLAGSLRTKKDVLFASWHSLYAPQKAGSFLKQCLWAVIMNT